MMPPPMPFKLFVLVAGVAGVDRRRLVAAVAIGRGIRYGGEAYLATLYGEQALRFVQENAFKWAVPAVLLAAVSIAAGLLWRRVRRRRAAAAGPTTPGNVE